MIPEEVRKLRAKIRKDRLKASILEERLRRECPHADVVEAPYAPESIVAPARPPFAVCVDCGYAEEGWHCGYWKLKPTREIGRLDATNLISKFYTQTELSELRFKRKTS